MNNIKQLRKRQGMSVTGLAEKLSMSQGNLTKIENGQLELKADMAQKIAAILNVSPLALTAEPITEGVAWLDVINPEILSLPPLSRLPVPAHMFSQTLQNMALYALPDDSMSPRFPAGSLVLINKSVSQSPQNGVYLLQIGQNIVLRRLQTSFSQYINLLCDNPAYPPQQIEIASINIIGKADFALSVSAF